MKEMEGKIMSQVQDTQKKLSSLAHEVEKLRAERRVQLETVEKILAENKGKQHDAVTGMAFRLVEALRETAMGKPDALMSTLLSWAPPEVATSIRSPPRMTRDLQTAVYNVIGLAAEEHNG
jgi:hypothetical protein